MANLLQQHPFTESPHLLVVDDHEDIRKPLAEFLLRYGFQVTAVADGTAMRESLSRQTFDLILLDVMLPGEDGLSLCRYVHEHLGTPVILLTAMDDPVDRVAGLEIGADDYVVKPFDPRELVARIRTIFRRMRLFRTSPAGQPRYEFSGWTLETARRTLHRADGEYVELSSTEFRLLRALLDHANTVLSREKLLDLINRGEAQVFDRSIDSQVSRLRKKLGDDSRNPALLRTAWGDGYLLSADVRICPA
jgi:two-component system OmpR family response regulator